MSPLVPSPWPQGRMPSPRPCVERSPRAGHLACRRGRHRLGSRPPVHRQVPPTPRGAIKRAVALPQFVGRAGLPTAWLHRQLALTRQGAAAAGSGVRPKLRERRPPAGRSPRNRGYHLPARYVLHTVGPVVQGRPHPHDAQVLASSYRACLDLAAEVENIRLAADAACASGGAWQEQGERTNSTLSHAGPPRPCAWRVQVSKPDTVVGASRYVAVMTVTPWSTAPQRMSSPPGRGCIRDPRPD